MVQHEGCSGSLPQPSPTFISKRGCRQRLTAFKQELVGTGLARVAESAEGLRTRRTLAHLLPAIGILHKFLFVQPVVFTCEM